MDSWSDTSWYFPLRLPDPLPVNTLLAKADLVSGCNFLYKNTYISGTICNEDTQNII